MAKQCKTHTEFVNKFIPAKLLIREEVLEHQKQTETMVNLMKQSRMLWLNGTIRSEKN